MARQMSEASKAAAMRSRLRKKNASLKPMVTESTSTKMNSTSSGIGGVLDNLKSKLAVLNFEIRADEKGKKDYDDQLNALRREKAAIQKRLSANEQWASNFERDVGPFEKKYAEMTHDMAGLYSNAKTKHAEGLQVLKDEFGYTPAFKRSADGFTGVPFKPK